LRKYTDNKIARKSRESTLAGKAAVVHQKHWGGNMIFRQIAFVKSDQLPRV
jgi:hypothetical protein